MHELMNVIDTTHTYTFSLAPEVTVDTRIGGSGVTTSMPVTDGDTDSEKGPYVDDYTGML